MKTKNTKMSKHIILLIVILVAAIVSGCGRGADTEPTNTSELEMPAPTNTAELASNPKAPTATPYPSGDTWDVSEEVPLEDWQVEVVMNDLEQFWGEWQRFDGALDCDAVINMASRLPITAEGFENECDEIYANETLILGPRFDWLIVADSTTWPDSKADAWPGGVALKLDSEYEWETFEIDPVNGTKLQTIYGKHAVYYAFLVYEDGMWRVYSLNKQVVDEDGQK